MRRRALLVVAMLLALVAVVVALPAGDPRTPPPPTSAPAPAPPVQEANGPRHPPVRYRDSRALGQSSAGRLVGATRLPALGPGFRTWDPIVRR